MGGLMSNITIAQLRDAPRATGGGEPRPARDVRRCPQTSCRELRFSRDAPSARIRIKSAEAAAAWSRSD